MVMEGSSSAGFRLEESGGRKLQLLGTVAGSCEVKREKGDESQDDCKEGIMVGKEHHKLEQAKAEIEEVREENQRLKKYLTQIMEDYKSLEKKFHDIVDQQELEAKKCTSTVTHQERELISLSLGRTSSSTHNDRKKDEQKHRKTTKSSKDDHEVDEGEKEGLALGLDCKFEVSSTTTRAESPANLSSGDNSVEEVKDDAGETWPPRKALKNARSEGGGNEVGDQQNLGKKARVSVRVRCETPTMNDGCQWRKYGQKIAKGNPCPRAYYRCTISPSCPVRKQVQRCAQDMSILVTTYEGTHNHPLPVSATAMASTTSAAACMLMSGSTVSGSNPNNPSSTTTTTPAELHGLHFYFSDSSKPNHYYPPNSSISPSPSCPTITLDLTSNTISSSSSSSPFNRSLMRPSSTNYLPRYSTTNLNFSSWNNGALINYGHNANQPFVKNQSESVNFVRHPQDNLYQAYMQKNITASSTQQTLQPEAIEAATKAITSDPNFQSALQAALSSIISSGGGGTGGSGSVDGGGQNNSKLGDQLGLISSSFPNSSSNANYKCVSASSYLNKSNVLSTSSTNPQPASLMFLPAAATSSSPLRSTSSKKSKSASPDHDST